MSRRLFVLAAALAVAGTASAEVSLESVHWQASRPGAGRASAWEDVRALSGAPKPADRLRARLVLKNDGTANEEGLLLRLSLTARVLPGDGSGEGSWSVPFAIDEKRVPKVGADKTIDVRLDVAPAVDLFLRRLAMAGWRPDRLKVQVMLEPHRGSKNLHLVEEELGLDAGKKP